MKCIKFISCVMIIISAAQIYAQDAFYYYDNEPINLYIDQTSIVLIFKPSSSFKNDISTFIGDTTIIEMDVSDGTEDIYFARLTYANEQNDILATIQTYGISSFDLEMYSYGYKTSDNIRIWLTGEVVLKLYPGFTINDIQNILNKYNAVFFEVDKYDVYSYKVTNASEAFNLANELVESDYVDFAEPDFSQDFKVTQQDPLYNEQYYLNNTGQIIDGTAGTPDVDIDAPEAWTVTTGSSSIRVAVIDDGVESNPVHEDMQGRVIAGFTPGCVSHCNGRPKKGSAHGEAVAGIIAANFNTLGVRGVAPGITIVPFKIFEWSFTQRQLVAKTNKRIAKAINKAWDDFDCDVLSNSWGGGASSSHITNAINDARTQGRNGKGSVVVFSAGNTSGAVSYPGNLAGVITVGAIDKFGDLWDYSATGAEIDVVAPSGDVNLNGDVRTTDREGKQGYEDPGNYTNSFGGTSAACPQVSGIAALLLSVNSSLTETEVRCRIREGARDIDALGFDNNTGFGLANAYYTVATVNMNIENEVVGLQDDFVASNTITIGPNCRFLNGSNVQVIAGTRIVAKAGSSAEIGSSFHAFINQIGPCGVGPFKTSTHNNQSIDDNYVQPDANIEKVNSHVINYPNPFNNNTIIKYNIENNSLVTLKVYNVFGKEVAKLIDNEYQEEGTYQIHFDASDLPSGIYFYTLKTNNNKITRKMIKAE